MSQVSFGPFLFKFPTVSTCSVSYVVLCTSQCAACLMAGYCVDVRREEDTSLWDSLTSFASGCTYVAKELEKGTRYRFRVRAENKFGTSEPAETEVVIAKDPYGMRNHLDSLLYFYLRVFLFYETKCSSLSAAAFSNQGGIRSTTALQERPALQAGNFVPWNREVHGVFLSSTTLVAHVPRSARSMPVCE